MHKNLLLKAGLQMGAGISKKRPLVSGLWEFNFMSFQTVWTTFLDCLEQNVCLGNRSGHSYSVGLFCARFFWILSTVFP